MNPHPTLPTQQQELSVLTGDTHLSTLYCYLFTMRNNAAFEGPLKKTCCFGAHRSEDMKRVNRQVLSCEMLTQHRSVPAGLRPDSTGPFKTTHQCLHAYHLSEQKYGMRAEGHLGSEEERKNKN